MQDRHDGEMDHVRDAYIWTTCTEPWLELMQLPFMLDERAIKVGHRVKIVGSLHVILGYKEELDY